jgi:hypothetical protein
VVCLSAWRYNWDVRWLICLLLSIPAANGIELPLQFEARDGAYVSHGAGYSLSLTSRDATFTLDGRTTIHL